MSGDHEDIAALVPAYQAGRTVAEVVERTLAVLGRVLVVDDGSEDDTGERAAAAGAEVTRLEINRGKGRALRTGFESLFGRGVEAVVTLDADGQHLPEEIPLLVRSFLLGTDLVLGARDHLFDQMVPLRRLSNYLSSKAISLAAGEPIADVQTGFRLYSRRLFERVRFPEPRFEAESAVVVRAARSGLRIRSVPIRLAEPDGRSTSHYRPIVDSLRIAIAVTRARLERPR